MKEQVSERARLVSLGRYLKGPSSLHFVWLGGGLTEKPTMYNLSYTVFFNVLHLLTLNIFCCTAALSIDALFRCFLPADT